MSIFPNWLTTFSRFAQENHSVLRFSPLTFAPSFLHPITRFLFSLLRRYSTENLVSPQELASCI